MLIEIKNIYKIYNEGKESEVRALDGVTLSIDRGEFVAIIGASGSGKSTLLRCVNLLETPTSGEITFHGENILTRKGGAAAYRTKVGMVFQSFNLFNNMSVLDNCTVGQIKVLKKSAAEAKELAMKYLTKVGMAPYINARPRQLSGGQKQRVAIARALATKPAILLADEPTGNLDSKTSQDVLSLMKVTGQKFAQTMVMITHNEEIAQMADRIVRIEDGRIVTR